MIQKQLNEPLPSIMEKRPDLPMRLDEMIGEATAKAPEDRYQDIEALLADFRQAMTVSEGRAAVPELPAFLTEELPPIEREIFVARKQELKWLGETLETSVEGQGSVLFVVGNAGSGKTALLQEFSRQAEKKIPDLLVVSGTCNMHSGVGDPYLPFRQILEVLTGDVEQGWNAGGISSDQARRLWTNIPVSAGELVENAPDLINRLVPGSALAARVQAAGSTSQGWWARLNQLTQQEKPASGELEQVFLFEQCSRFLRNVSQSTPLLLVLDDLQWADAASIGLLFHLGRSISSSRILLIGAYRPDEVALGRISPSIGRSERHPLESVANELTRIHGETTLDLGQDDEKERRTFVDAFLDTEPNQLDEGFRRALYEHAEGHPLFTVELLRAMQERGELVQDEAGRWNQGAKMDWEKLPIRVEAVIAERIGRLDDDLRQMISVASVEGEEFTAQVVARVQEAPEAHILHDLTENAGRRHRLVREHGEVRAGTKLLARYKFVHQLLQRYLYNGLGQGERRLLHRQIAEALEELYGAEVEEIAVVVAYHYQEAGDAKRAFPYLVQAGDAARDEYANDEAEAFYRAALDITTEEKLRAELLRALGRILVRKSAFEEALNVWKDAIWIYQSHGDWDRVAWLYARSSRALSISEAGEEERALEVSKEGLALIPADRQSADIAALLHESGRAHYFNGMPDKALPLCIRALEMAEDNNSNEVMADTLATLGILPGQGPEDARLALEKAVELAEDFGLSRIVSRAHHNLGFVLCYTGNLSEAMEHGLRAADIAHRRGSLLREWWNIGNPLGWSMEMGDFKAADRLIARREQLKMALASSDYHFKSARHYRLEMFRGQLEDAIGKLRDMAGFSRLRGDLQEERLSLDDLAEVLLELRRLQEASDIQRAVVRLSETHSRPERVISRARLSRIYSLEADVVQARQTLNDAIEIAGESMYALERAHLSWAEAQLLAAEENLETAAEGFDEAISTFEKMEYAWLKSQVMRDWAEAYANRGQAEDISQARNLLEQVRSMYEEMELPFYVAKVTRQLKSLAEN